MEPDILAETLVRNRASSKDQVRLAGVVITVVVVATLYFARDVFIPLALAILLSVVLAPVVMLLEKIRVARAPAVALVMAFTVAVVGGTVWETSLQILVLTKQLPAYKATLKEKIDALKGPTSERLGEASSALGDLEKEIFDSGAAKKSQANPANAKPTPVEIVPPANPLESAQHLFGPLSTAGIVLVFTIFILLGREDLRDRLIRLAAGHRLNVMTQAMDEATRRVNRYLFLQLLVNLGFGTVVGTGLQLIGIPNAGLWGLAAAILRFLPYVGAPLAAVIPLLLSVAVFPGWQHAAITAGMYVGLELVAANVVEPYLYGAHIGLSPLAILMAAVFWTLIWGFPGLLLSTPLTVCLVVMGRYVPGLGMLNVALGDEPVLPPHAQFYQRLLAGDQEEAAQVLEKSLKEKSLEEVYSGVVVPALGLAEIDRHRDELSEETQNFINLSSRELAEELAEMAAEREREKAEELSEKVALPAPVSKERLRVMCLPARDEADYVVATLLARLLELQNISAESVERETLSEMASQVEGSKPDAVCISALPPFAVDHARVLLLKIRMRLPEMPVMVCLWHSEGNLQKIGARLKLGREDSLFTTLPEVVHHVVALGSRERAAETSEAVRSGS